MIVITPPALDAITLQEAKQQLRIDHNDEDAYLTDLIAMATNLVEIDTERSLMMQTLLAKVDDLYGCIEIVNATVQSINSIHYKDLDNVDQLLPATDYELVKQEKESYIIPTDNSVWPSVKDRPQSVAIEFTAGYVSRELIPPLLKRAMLLLIADFYENREHQMVGVISSKNVLGYDRLIKSFIRFRF